MTQTAVHLYSFAGQGAKFIVTQDGKQILNQDFGTFQDARDCALENLPAGDLVLTTDSLQLARKDGQWGFYRPTWLNEAGGGQDYAFSPTTPWTHQQEEAVRVFPELFAH